MYFKIKDDIIFRKYDRYGYITDNSMFGYKILDGKKFYPGERFVSESGAVILACLSKKPKFIDEVINELLKIFVDINFEELKKETIIFLKQFVDEGFLSSGETVEECENFTVISRELINDEIDPLIKTENCSKTIFSENEFLRSIHIEITSKCNERCVHCYIPHELKTEAIDSDLFYSIIKEARKLNVINITLSGGEPLLHKNFVKFLQQCKELDMSVNILSNLTLLTDQVINEIADYPLISVQTSIYSMNPEVHDFITKMDGSLEKTKNAILRLKALGIPVQISCPIMKQNKDTFIDVIKWGNEHGILVLTDYVIFAAYDHSNCNLINRLSLEEVGDAIDQQMSVKYANQLIELAKEKEHLSINDSACSICRYNFCVSADGKVFPCVGWQGKVIGDLNHQTIREIWENSLEIKELRGIKMSSFPKCVNCKDRGYCTICMMENFNENPDGNAFKINDYHCAVSAMLHRKVDAALKNN